MSLHLIETMEAALEGLAQEVTKDASVMVQFAAGDWAKIRAAVSSARAAHDAANVPQADPVQAAPAESEPVAETDAPVEPPAAPVVEVPGAAPAEELPPVNEQA